MTGFEWWTGSAGQWLFVGMVFAPVVAATIMSYIARK